MTNKTLIIFVVGIVGVVLLILFTQGSKKEIYNLSMDCAERATEYLPKLNNGSLSTYSLVQSAYKSGLCYAEYGYMETGSGSYREIYDLTHSKEVAYLPPPADFESAKDIWLGYKEEYDRYHKIFNE